MRSIVVIVAKEPVENRVKTRLCPTLNAGQARELYTLFVQDMVEELSGISMAKAASEGDLCPSVTLALAYTPEGAEAAFRTIVPTPIPLLAQQGADLGERLANIFHELCGKGYDQVHIVNSDSPDMPSELISRSIRLLTEPQTDLVLGPCDDGGYYLVGLKKCVPELFAQIPWSTEQVLQKTVTRAQALGLSFSLLEPWYDIDTCQDLFQFLARNAQRTDVGHGPGWRTLRYLRPRIHQLEGAAP